MSAPEPQFGTRASLSVAPMMDRTDRHFRFFMRQITRHTLLYTEMVPVGAIIHGERAKFLDFDACEHPLVLQVGGSDPEKLAECAVIAEQWGYDAININVGCPSDRVKEGHFGAALMGDAPRVAEAVEKMRARVSIPVTVKHRIGIDHHDSYDFMSEFVSTVAAGGCTQFSVHARIAWLNGLSPKENRRIPPLRYDDVYRLKKENPELFIEINGGIKTLDEARAHLDHVDAVMIGRAAYDTPFMFAEADQKIFKDGGASIHYGDVLESMLDYADHHLRSGGRLHSVTRHLLQLFAGQPGARAWRRFLSEKCRHPNTSMHTLREGAQQMLSRLVESSSVESLRV